jgi:hypothetical protein
VTFGEQTRVNSRERRSQLAESSKYNRSGF